MNKQVIVQQKGGVGFLGLLTIAFIVLKLMGVIAWSWFWVLSPILIPVILALLGFVVFIIAAVIASK
jgi:hypothetical protein